MPIPIDQFKHIMRQWVSGVTIVSMRSGDWLHGLTVSGFLSVSLEPPLVLISIGQELQSHATLKKSGAFAVNFLSEEQRTLSDRFAGRLGDVDRFDGVPYRTAETGSPILQECLAWLDCRIVASYAAGDHTLYIGEVVAAGTQEQEEGRPLLYWNADYRRLDGD
jgi:flavin reductase (DIM6/NTAB) family NADH-FMN oxidoreductase RutF